MAKSDTLLSGSFGNYSIYKMEGSEKNVIRMKGGPSYEKMKTAPTLEAQRKQAKQFGGSSKSSKMIGYALSSVKHLQDYRLHGHLNKLNGAILKMDTGNPAGKRSIIYSRGLHLFEGLNLNRKILFDSVVTTSIGFSVNIAERSASISIPSLSPGLNFINPWNQPFYRFRMNLGIVRDMVYKEGIGYEPVTADIADQTVVVDTDWVSSKVSCSNQEIELILEDPVFDENSHLLLSIGIEFGAQADGSIRHVRKAGCAKILIMT